MAGTRIHTHVCVYFDDGGFEPLCVCGQQAVLVVDEDGHTYLIPLDEAPDTAEAEAQQRHQHVLEGLPISA